MFVSSNINPLYGPLCGWLGVRNFYLAPSGSMGKAKMKILIMVEMRSNEPQTNLYTFQINLIDEFWTPYHHFQPQKHILIKNLNFFVHGSTEHREPIYNSKQNDLENGMVLFCSLERMIILTTIKTKFKFLFFTYFFPVSIQITMGRGMGTRTIILHILKGRK